MNMGDMAYHNVDISPVGATFYGIFGVYPIHHFKGFFSVLGFFVTSNSGQFSSTGLGLIMALQIRNSQMLRERNPKIVINVIMV